VIAIDYNQIAADYARHRRVHPEVLGRLTAGLRPTDTVLEVGCGTGNYLVAIHEAVGCVCQGIDPSQEMLAQAAARSGEVHLSLGTAEDLDVQPSSFDLVFSVDVIHHVGDRARFFRQAAKALRPGGRVCTVTDSEWVIRHRQPLAVYFPETVAVDLARYPRLPELRADMGAAGFVEVSEETVEFAYKLNDLGPFRARAFSCLRLIPEGAFRRGIEQMERDVRAGPIPCVSRYTLVWGSRPSVE
jgi:SAM-dependent methyltransferase